ncbi:hypothetical protein BCY89_09525 [Sphingobacterium siyangense]|uniref:Uncharacterized protein n=1 Tax=Sphingobacterium siyangense TaxID=459529 RepID=A0A420FQ95_9SPHI|nr:hypothetical protein BCY89_09525 [Sphingobacterium siyangense]
MLFWRFKTYFWFPVLLSMIIVCLTYFSLINYCTWISIMDILIQSSYISSKYRFLIGNSEVQYVERLFETSSSSRLPLFLHAKRGCTKLLIA